MLSLDKWKYKIIYVSEDNEYVLIENVTMFLGEEINNIIKKGIVVYYLKFIFIYYY